MNRVAVITDIHANLPALEATLAARNASLLTRSIAVATWSATGHTRTRSVR